MVPTAHTVHRGRKEEREGGRWGSVGEYRMYCDTFLPHISSLPSSLLPPFPPSLPPSRPPPCVMPGIFFKFKNSSTGLHIARQVGREGGRKGGREGRTIGLLVIRGFAQNLGSHVARRTTDGGERLHA